MKKYFSIPMLPSKITISRVVSWLGRFSSRETYELLLSQLALSGSAIIRICVLPIMPGKRSFLLKSIFNSIILLFWMVSGAQEKFSQENNWCSDLPDGRTLCCSSGYILRPGHGICESGHKLAPFIDPRTMTYNGEYDKGFLPIGNNTLELLAILVIDNGEGEGWPHGPAGNLYYDLFDCSEYLPAPPDKADKRTIDGPRVLHGPDHTHGTTYEWGKDDVLLKYCNAGLFNWGERDCVTLRIWESDSKSEDGSSGRRNDVLGLERLNRIETMNPEGVWIPMHKYTNDHPRRRTDKIAIWIKLRTLPVK
jgi:hypothetical protein